jgi:hypothetical protein
MFKDQILKKGMHKAPEELETEETKEIELSDYLSWLPCVGTLLLLRDFFSGEKIRISPVLKI